MGFNWVNTREGFQTPLGDKEMVRIVMTEHGKRVLKQGALGGVVFGVGLALTLNRFGTKHSEVLRSQAADVAAKAAQAVDPNGGTR